MRPEALCALIGLLEFGTSDLPVAKELARRIALVMHSPPNLDVLFAPTFIDWCNSFMHKASPSPPPSVPSRTQHI